MPVPVERVEPLHACVLLIRILGCDESIPILSANYFVNLPIAKIDAISRSIRSHGTPTRPSP